MAYLLDDIADYLVGKGINTSSLFVESMPDGANIPKEIVTLYEYQGTSTIAQMDSTTRQVQVVTRSSSTVKARTLASAIHKFFRSEDGILELANSRWATVHLNQPPFKLKVDEAGRSHYAFNMSITTQED